ncbi:hypothetical protein CHS0354_006324 [Potamilus streckersoni]|uniref:Uncharacterized protein n=1 Tax=Potamilus streckersoni TaxID=2493646 RepID=A0AAE0VPK1_9BIVA|nr:hypothetical protein CHS0354_006324 [Potamilus streckersoni]
MDSYSINSTPIHPNSQKNALSSMLTRKEYCVGLNLILDQDSKAILSWLESYIGSGLNTNVVLV